MSQHNARFTGISLSPILLLLLAGSGLCAVPAAFRGDGGFSFRASFDGNGVTLGRTDYALPSRKQRVLPAYQGASIPLLEVIPGPAPVSRAAIEQTAWDHRVARYELANSGRTGVVLSRLSPAILLESTGNTISFRAAKGGDPAVPAPAFLAFVSKGKVVIRPADGLAGDPPVLDEPWLLGWFGGATPYRGYTGVIDVDDENAGAGFARAAPPPVPLDLPILLRMEKQPQAIVFENGLLTFRFAGACGKLAIMPLMGGEVIEPKQTQQWQSKLPEDILARCRLWCSALRDYPLTVTEDYSVDAEKGVVKVQQSFSWSSFDDDWKSPPVKAAPIPPMLALALGGRPQVSFHRPDGSTAEPVDYRLMDTPGKAMAIVGADSYEYHVAALGQYLLPQPAAAIVTDAARPLRAKLEKHVREMIEAGHLAPLLYVYGGIGGLKPGYFYWANSAELAEALAAAQPYLSKELQRQAKAYLSSEWKLNPPLELNLDRYLQGASRAPYEIPWDLFEPRDLSSTYIRERALREARFFGDLYGIALYGQLTGEKLDTSRLRSRIDDMMHDLVASQDWALMAPVKTHTDRLEFMTGASYYERNGQATCNSRLAGSIGLVRLARRLGWQDQERLGWYLFAKLALARIGQARYAAEAHRMGLVRGQAKDDWRTLVHIDANCAILLRGNPKPVVQEDQELPPFIDLVPEVGRLLGAHARQECRIYLDHVDRAMPLWYISEAPKQSASEQRLCPLQHKSGNVLAQSWVLDKKGKSFLRYVDTTRFKGDLYYIKNLAAAIESYNDQP